MVVPIKFRKASATLANYNFLDIASGTGYINFYAGADVDYNYVLSNNIFYSHLLGRGGASNSTTPVKAADLDFDVLINRPTTVQGRAIVEVPIKVVTGNQAGTCYVTIKLRKYSGVTETELGNNDTDTNVTAAATTAYWGSTLFIDLPQTHFKIGDYFRMTVEVWINIAAAGTATTLYVGIDPAERSADYRKTPLTWSTSYSSRLRLQLPVRIQQ